MNNVNKYAVIVAGGKGVRMGGDIPKQFLPLGGVPIICRTIQAFYDALSNLKIILVVPAEQEDGARTLVKSYFSTGDITIVLGGETRFHSVQNGLKMVQNDGVVFVHDGVRPMASKELINRCYEQALEKGSAIPAVPVTDSIRMVEDGEQTKPIDRSTLRIIQTPQTFRTGIILPAFQQPYQAAFTDEATVVEAYGKKIFLTEGDYTNIKITTPGDMAMAGALLKAHT